jgi:hypothetical protein
MHAAMPGFWRANERPKSNSLCGSLWVLIASCIHYRDRHGYRARVRSLGADPTLVVSDILTD